MTESESFTPEDVASIEAPGKTEDKFTSPEAQTHYQELKSEVLNLVTDVTEAHSKVDTLLEQIKKYKEEEKQGVGVGRAFFSWEGVRQAEKELDTALRTLRDVAEQIKLAEQGENN